MKDYRVFRYCSPSLKNEIREGGKNQLYFQIGLFEIESGLVSRIDHKPLIPSNATLARPTHPPGWR